MITDWHFVPDAIVTDARQKSVIEADWAFGKVGDDQTEEAGHMDERKRVVDRRMIGCPRVRMNLNAHPFFGITELIQEGCQPGISAPEATGVSAMLGMDEPGDRTWVGPRSDPQPLAFPPARPA